ncbi:MAG TPA: hypothetical protein VME67_20210 [Mycobacterium sp.]|nr:hypothetical protein [Mycobacterium sp.]HTX96962.1 hypothetical protein [Mycobacterium sp.]
MTGHAERVNTRGYDSSRLLASHKGVGILRPDGDTQAGADVLALTVRTTCPTVLAGDLPARAGAAGGRRDAQRARGRRRPGTGARPLGGGAGDRHRAGAAAPSRSAGVPEPLASIVDHLDELDEAPEFISTAISPRCSTSTRVARPAASRVGL